MKIEKIYVDMDGVMADFDRGLDELCGMKPIEQDEKTGTDDTAMWDAIRDTEHFYRRLKFMPGAKEMLLTLHREYGNNCQILSAVPKPWRRIDTASEDKLSWIRAGLPEIVDDLTVNLVHREQKKDYIIGEGCILIDDYAKNIEEWEANGGTGILFQTAEDAMRQIREIESR